MIAQTTPQTLLAQLIQAERRGRPAIQLGSAVLTYGDLTRLVEATAGCLVAWGLQPGDRVLLIFPNCAEHIVAVLAVTSLGGIAVPLDADTGPGRVAYVVDDTAPRLCLILRDASAPPGPAALRLQVDFLAKAIHCSPSPSHTGSAPNPTQRVTADSEALIRFSSGSTGHPKGIVLKHKQVFWTAQTLSTVYGIDAAHRELIIVSMAFSDGWQRVAATLYSGGCVIFSPGPLSVSGILEDIETYAVTGFFTPPPLARMLLGYPPEKVRAALTTCRSIEIGSAPITVRELEQLLELAAGARIFVHYGMTECSRAVILDARAHPDKLATVGKTAPGVELTIVGDDGHPLGFGQSGQIFLRGPQQASGYWNRPDLDKVRFVDGWLATGDYGLLDELGFLTFIGRADDMINSAGYSFFPAEVETELGPVEGVVQYLVAGVPDPRGILGQVPWAFVVPADPKTWHPREFISLARKRLPSYMVPRWVITVSELPLTPSGKPDRRRAVELYATKTEN